MTGTPFARSAAKAAGVMSSLVITEWDRSHTTLERFDEVVVAGRRAEPTQRRCYPAWPVIDYEQEGRT